MRSSYLLALFLVSILLSCTSEGNEAKNEITQEVPVQIPKDQELFDLIREKDSVLFQIGFNQIDTAQVASLTARNFEFYHDEHGMIETKIAFLESIAGIGDLPFKTWRTLDEGSMEVFPLYAENSRVLYGAIQNGIHDFYQQKEGEDARKTNTAKFTHLWIIEENEWKLKRVLSYDHHLPE